jgi:hypothetical protein
MWAVHAVIAQPLALRKTKGILARVIVKRVPSKAPVRLMMTIDHAG